MRKTINVVDRASDSTLCSDGSVLYSVLSTVGATSYS